MESKKSERLSEEEALEEVERLGRAVRRGFGATKGDEEWQDFDTHAWVSKYIKNQADADTLYELAREFGYEDVEPGDEEKIRQFIEKLKEGMYIGPLESYGVQWDEEKIARDLLQNFFDANDYTLDGVTIDVKKDERGLWKVVLEGKKGYDFRELLHLGGTTKEEDTRAAGGFGEGAKISAFLLLRDHNVSSVQFGANDWTMEFYLKNLPREQYTKPTRGLHVRLSVHEPRDKSVVQFTTDDARTAAAISAARDLFYHSKNPDFQNPTLSNEFGGIKVFEYKQKGNFYEAGQRRHVDRKNLWNTVEGLTIWTNRKTEAPKDRDRGMYASYELPSIVFRPFVESLTQEQVRDLIVNLKPFWVVPERIYEAPRDAANLLEILADRAEKEHIAIPFDDSNIAISSRYEREPAEKLLEENGFTLNLPLFLRLGMPSAFTAYRKFIEREHILVESSQEEIGKIQFLESLAQMIQQVNPGLLPSNLPPVRLYNQTKEKSIVHGYFATDFILLSQEALQGDLAHAVMVYFHELAHVKSPHHDTIFAYHKGKLLEEAFRIFLSVPEIHKQGTEQFKEISS